MNIFDHDREELRAATRLRAASDPPPLPATTRSGSRHRLVPSVTQAQMARSLIGCGAILLTATLAAGCWIVLSVGPITLSWRVLLGFLALLALLALWSVWEGFATRRRSRLPGYALELDDPDFVTGQPIAITILQERGGSLTDVRVTLGCDETIIEEVETRCDDTIVDEVQRCRRHHRANGAGQRVHVTRTPTTSRIFECEVLSEPELDASRTSVTRTAEITLDPLVEPSGATLDHSIKWRLELRATMQDGSALSDDYEVRVRRP